MLTSCACIQRMAVYAGHTDNLAPCIYGGAQIGVFDTDQKRWDTHAVPVPNGLRCVIFTPSTPMSTEYARSILPKMIDRKDAVFNLGRTALLVLAFCTDRLELLKTATEDALHQPYRGAPEVMPALFPCIRAALGAGAVGAFLSGAGSSIMAITAGASGEPRVQRDSERCDAEVGDAMVEAAGSVGVVGKVRVPRACFCVLECVCVRGSFFIIVYVGSWRML